MSKCIMCGEREWVSVGVCAQCLGLPELENETKRFKPTPEQIQDYMLENEDTFGLDVPSGTHISAVLTALALMKLEVEDDE